MIGDKIKRTVDISVVVPTMNEEVTALQFIEWCKEGFRNSGLSGEIVFLDSSTDATAKIAAEHGVTVVHCSEKGLGNAYRAGKGIPKGKYIILGDADCTYDFRNLRPFVEKLEEGFDLVLGNRFKGIIEKDSMPFHHQYFGSPGTSMFFRYALGIPTGDIHCGMRAMTVELYDSLPFLEPGWEYATEMIISARNEGAAITEIPIAFFKEPAGRLSHHKRASWTSPFKAGWGTLRVTFTYLFDRIFVLPGVFVGALGTLSNIVVSSSPKAVLEKFQLGLLAQTMLLSLTILGSGAFALGSISQFAYRRKNPISSGLVRKKITKNLFSIWMFLTFIQSLFTILLFSRWLSGFFSQASLAETNYLLSSVWISFTSFYCLVFSLTLVGLIGGQAKRFTELNDQ